MKVSFQVDKIIKFTIIIFFFTLAGGGDEGSVMLSLIEQFIKDANTMHFMQCQTSTDIHFWKEGVC